MPPPPHAKPENVLKRAQELVAVNKNLSALELLHDHVTAKRTRNSPIPALEPVMIMFVELCVSLRKGKTAKDGLYQYKNIAQNTSVPTIELVLKKFIELAENKVTEAQERAEQIIKLDQIDDLEASETPESVLLSTVSGEQSKDRTDRAVVTPWLKFLWETYRTVLDILRNNARLEIMYQTTAFQAFKFCQKYTRKTEFRRLCELLRNHVQNAAKYANTMHAINLNDPDTLQRHLDTRFQQLNVAVELELWQEAFRSVEDIHTLLTLSKKQAKNVMMANYYEQLTEIFMRSENYLFHAAAFSRLYNLLLASAAQVAQNPALKKDSPDASKEERVRVASLFLLSALSIPVISQARSRGTLLDVDEAKRTKNTRLTNLLGMSRAPTRAALFKDIINKGILKIARPEIRELYTILEVDFHPLSICKKISPILEKIAADEKLQRYVHPLQQVILTRLFQQLSQVYDSVQLKFVLDLATFPSPFEVTPSIIEKFIMNGCKKGDLSIRIDHAAGVLTFESDIFSSTKPLHPGSGAGSAEKGSIQKLQSTPSEIVRTQMSRLAKACYITLTHVDPEFVAERQVAKEAAQQRALKGAAKEHKDTLARRTIIERKKEAAESALIKKEKEEAAIRAQKQEEARAAEAARVAEAQRLRDQARIKAEQDRIRKEEIKKQLEDLALKNKVDLDKIDDLDSNAIRRMKLEQLEKEKKDMSEKLRITGKRIDHLERAYRREEVKLLPQDYERQRAQDLAAYEEEKKLTLETAKTQHEEAVALKHRLGRLVGSYESFRDRIKEERAAIFEANRKRAEKELEKAKEKRRQEVRAAREAELRAQEEEERRRREEEERIAREEQEKKEREERVREEMKKRKEEREREQAKLDQIAALQRQREQEAEERRAREKAEREQSRAAPPTAAGAETGGRWRPSTGGWRDRMAAKAGGEQPAAPSLSACTDSNPRETPRETPPRADSNPRPEPRAEGPSERPRLNLAPRTLPKPEAPATPEAAPAPSPAAASPQSEERRPTPSAGGAYRLPAKRTEGTASPGTSTPRHNNGPYRRRDNGQEGGSPAPQEGEKPQGNKYIPPSQRQGGWRK